MLACVRGQRKRLTARRPADQDGGVTTAIFPLIGVLLGGTITFGIQYFMARRGETATTRTTARLMSLDLARISATLETRLSDPRAGREPWAAELRSDEWPARLEKLAQRLSRDEWDAVAAPLEHIERVRATIARADWTPALAADSEARKRLEETKGVVELAQKKLEPHLD
jgi:hypothetical protein